MLSEPHEPHLYKSGVYNDVKQEEKKLEHRIWYILSKWAEILAVFTASLGALSDGIQYGWSSPGIPLLLSADSPVKIQKGDDNLIEVIYMCGGILGLPITIFVIDKLGRKKTIILAASHSFIAWCLIGVANTRTILFVGRFVAGVSANMMYVTVPMYIAEMSDPKILGFLETMFHMLMLIGVIIAYSVVPYIKLKYSALLGGSLVMLQIITFSFIPESPYFSLLINQRDKAKQALKWFRQKENVEEELEDISLGVERQKSERGKLIDLFINPSNRKAFLIMLILNTGINFGGISIIIMNIQLILDHSNGSFSTKDSAILFGVAMLVASIVAGVLIDKCGRKILLITSCMLTSITLAILAVYFYLKDVEHMNMSYYSNVPFITVIIYAFVYKFGLGLIPMITASELFPTSMKAIGMTLADSVFIIGGIIALEVYHITMSVYGLYVPFIVFSICTLFMVIFAYWILPETKGKTLEEIQQILKGKSS